MNPQSSDRPPGKMGIGVRSLLLALLVLGGAGLLFAQSASPRGSQEPPSSKEVWFFFSPVEGDLSKEVIRIGRFVRKYRGLVLRPCLLVEDWSSIKKATREFGETVKALRTLMGPSFSLRIWDDAGLAMAQQLKVMRLPAISIVSPASRSRQRSAHLVYGCGANLEELLRCRSCR